MRILIPIVLLFTGCANWEVVESDHCCGGHIHHTSHTVYVVDHHHHRHDSRRKRDRTSEPYTPRVRPTPPTRPLPVPGRPPQNPPAETRRPGEKHDP